MYALFILAPNVKFIAAYNTIEEAQHHAINLDGEIVGIVQFELIGWR